MHYRLLWLVGLIWCCQESNCEEGRSFISASSYNELKNNAIDLHDHKDVSQSSGTYNNVQMKNSDLNDPINNPLNSINLDNSHNFLKKRRIVRSVKELIKPINLGERYPSDQNSNKTFEEAIEFLNENDRR